MFPSPFGTKRLLLNEESISKQAQSTPNASQAEITLPLEKKSNPDELVSWIDGLESRVKDTLRHQNNELEQFNVEYEREKAKDKYRYAVFEQSFQKLGHIVQNNRLDSETESATEANKMNIDESGSKVAKESQESYESQEVSENESDSEENVVREQSDDSDIIEIIESEEEMPEASEEEIEEEQSEENEQENELEVEEDMLFGEVSSQPSYSKPRLMDDRKYMSGLPSSHTREPEQSEHESENENEHESENEVLESEMEDDMSNEEVSVSDRENDSDDMVEEDHHSGDTYVEPENYHETQDSEYQADTQNQSFRPYRSNAMDVNYLHNPHEPESYEESAAHSNHDLNNYFTVEYNHADIDADYGSDHTHMDDHLHATSHAIPHQNTHGEVSVTVEEISSTLENENDNNDDNYMHSSDVGSDENADEDEKEEEEEDDDDEEEEEENDHESGQADTAHLEKSVLESIASFMTGAHNEHKNDAFEPESVNANLDEHEEDKVTLESETETSGHLEKHQENTSKKSELETLPQTEEHQEIEDREIAIESESEEESNSPPPLIFRTLLEHEPEEVLDQLKETEKRFNIKLNVVSAMEEELSQIPDSSIVDEHSDDHDDLATAIQEAIESSQTNADEEYQQDSELEAIQNNEIQAVLDSFEQLERPEASGSQESGEADAEIKGEDAEDDEKAEENPEQVSEVPLPHIEKPILEAVSPGPEETYIDATTEIDVEEDSMEKRSISNDSQPNVDQKLEHELADILGSESKYNEGVSILKKLPSIDNNQPESESSCDLEVASEFNERSSMPEEATPVRGESFEEDVSILSLSQSQDIEKNPTSDNIQPVDDAKYEIGNHSVSQLPSEDNATSPTLDDQPPAGKVNHESDASGFQSEEIDDNSTTKQSQLISVNENITTLQSLVTIEKKTVLEEGQPIDHLDTENASTFEVQSEKIKVTDEHQMDEEEEVTQQDSVSIIQEVQTVEPDVEMEDVDNVSSSGMVNPETIMEEDGGQKDAEDISEQLVGDMQSNGLHATQESSTTDEDVQMEGSIILHEAEPTSLNSTGEHEDDTKINILNIEANEKPNEVENEEEKEMDNEEEIETEVVVESKVEYEVESDVENEPEIEVQNEEEKGMDNEEQIEPEVVVESEVEYKVENDVENNVQSEVENEPEIVEEYEEEKVMISETEIETENEVQNKVESEGEVENDSGEETDLGNAEPESNASVTVQGIVAGDEGLTYVEIEETVTEVQEVLYPSAIFEPLEEQSAEENINVDRLEAEEFFSNDDDEESMSVALPSVIIEAEGGEVLASYDSEQSNEVSSKQDEEIVNEEDEPLASSNENDNHDEVISKTGKPKDEITHSAETTDKPDTEPEQTSGRKRAFEEVEESEAMHLEGSTFKRFRTFVSSFFGKKRETSSNQAEDVSLPRITPPTLSPVESETEVEEYSEVPFEAPIGTKDENEDSNAFGVESVDNEELSSSTSDAGANNEVNDSEAETEVSDEGELKENERKNRFDVQADLESVPTVEAIQTLKKRHPRMLQGLDISEEMLQPSHSLRNGHTYGKPGSLESALEEPKLHIPKRGMRRQNVPKLIDTSIKPDKDYPAFRTRSKSPLKRSLQEIISTEEDVIAPRRRSRRVAQREEEVKTPESNYDENDGMDDRKTKNTKDEEEIDSEKPEPVSTLPIRTRSKLKEE